MAAHLTLQQVGFGGMPAMTLSWPGSLERTILHLPCRRAAALSTEQIIAEIRAMAGSRRHCLSP